MPDLPPPPPPGLLPAGAPLARPTSPAATLVGLLLVAPAAVALLIGYVWPTIRTGWLSTRIGNPVSGYQGVGLDNYSRALTGDDTWWGSLVFALSLALLPVLVLVLVAPLLALAAHHAGRGATLAVRLALAVPMVCFVPVALALAWRFDRFGRDMLEPGEFAASVRAAVWLTAFGLLCGLGVTCYLAALRRRDGRSPWPAVGTVAGLAAVAAVAVGLQAFTYPHTMTGGGPRRATTTPMLDVYQNFIRLEFGFAATHATLLLIGLMLLGIGAAVLVILTGLRVEVDRPAPAPADRPPGPDLRAGAIVATVVLLVGLLAVAGYGLWPWLTRLGFPPTDASTIASVLTRTWLPPMVSTVIGVGLAAVAAFGIGALRPLGRRSELLLLPFAPWLFVGVGPLVIVKFESASEGLVPRLDNVLGWIPPVWIVVPVLFLLTLLFRGLAQQPDRSGRPLSYGRMMLWALPMVGLLGGATYLVQSQSLLWGLLVSLGDMPAPVWALRWSAQYAADASAQQYGLVLPIPAVIAFAAALALLQVFYLRRLAIRVGRPASPSYFEPVAR